MKNTKTLFMVLIVAVLSCFIFSHPNYVNAEEGYTCCKQKDSHCYNVDSSLVVPDAYKKGIGPCPAQDTIQ